MSAYLLHHSLFESAARLPGAPAIVELSGRTRYEDLALGANRLAHLLRDLGVARGDRVALCANNSGFYAQGFYGALTASAVAVPLNAKSTPEGLAETLRDCGARAVLVGRGLEATVSAALALPTRVEAVVLERAALVPFPEQVHVSELRDADALPAEAPGGRAVDLDLAAIIYTSGSTGVPRGAMLTHAGLMANARSIVSYLDLTAADRVLAVLPFHYVYGKSLLTTHVAVGGAVVIENRSTFPHIALDTIDREQCTGLAGVPSTYAVLLSRSNLADRPLRSLRYVTQAGGAMSPNALLRLRQALPNKRIFVMYGATEASGRLAYLPPNELEAHPDCIGDAIPNVELRVLRPDGAEAALGEQGELVARGTNIMRGYWNHPEETARVLDEHGYHTGDLAVREPCGLLRIVGRTRDMIKAGGHRVSALEVEHALAEIPGVEEAAVVGAPDELLGETIIAFVATSNGHGGEEEVRREASKRLPAFKVPNRVFILAGLPKSAAGKVLKEDLRRLAAVSCAETSAPNRASRLYRQ